MPTVNFERTIKKTPVRGEVYRVFDSAGGGHTLVLNASGKGSLNLPKGRTILGIRFAGSINSEVNFNIEIPSCGQKYLRKAKIAVANVVVTPRLFTVCT